MKTNNPNEAVINLLKNSHTDLSKRRPIDFYLYFPTEEKARKADAILTCLGFEVECSQSTWKQDNNWLCLATRKIRPDVGTLTLTGNTLERVAYRLDGYYDGWETMLDADEAKGLPNVD